MKRILSLLLIFCFISIFAEKALLDCGFPVPNIEFNPKIYNCLKTETAPILDGKLDDEAWKMSEWTDEFVDIEGNSKPLPYLKTKAKLLWDEDNLYIAAEMEEPQLWATLKDHDSVIYFDNDFEVFLDPDWDTQNYYEMEMNALNTTWDLLITQTYYEEDCHAIDSWEIAGMQTAVHLNGTLNDPEDEDIGWSLEIAMPWKVLEECANHNGAPQPQEMWRMNFSRVQWELDVVNGRYEKKKKSENNWVWSPQGIIAMHYPEMWGVLVFCENKDQFITDIPKLDCVDILRKFYYIQKGFHLQNHYYATLNQLEQIPGYSGIVAGFQLFLTPNGYEALYKDDKFSCTIRQDRKMKFRKN
ncbi:MAG: carbohydrate-binding family 9-like protein [Candidatus Cloacimonetes bacterium]|nr:carbohydrate-binding family 9-like protein [Candidatus Cloacimonadota bacterium]MCF7815140.1 carbohydrate-binding family 9-like protein [Candidatus Cloacimonadota bacterium]MCF7869219.1 carbohydrate-binding family 9-like protein [Candidatus Cloacimonadota bacterium]MCF7884759.1 carbohydrate-binding family 9-like protein [Candidatus Cloacimonadota bacterium]